MLKRYLTLLALLITTTVCVADNLSFLNQTQNQNPTANLFSQQPTTQQQLPVDQAFSLSVNFQNDQKLIARWQIAPGFMLYQNRIKIKTAPHSSAKIGDILIPPNDTLQKKFVDGKPIFENYANAFIPIANQGDGNLQLLIHYQGCKGRHYCYPPQNKLVTINLASKAISISNAPADMALKVSDESTSTQDSLFHHNSFILVILSFFGFGILLSFTPCILPMLPILWSIIVGKDHRTRHALLLASAYVLSMAVTFAIIGVIAAFAGHSLQAALQNIWVIAVFCIILLLLALSMFDVYEFQMPKFLQRGVNQINQEQKPGTVSGAIVMGCLSTLVVSPCVSAPLIAALLYIAKTGDVVLGGTSLFALALGMGLPLLIICVAGHKFLPKSGNWMVSIKRIFGFIVIGLAIWLLARFIPGPATLFLYALLFIAAAVYLGIITVRSKKRWPLIKRVLAALLFAYGIVLLLGAVEGNNDPLRPFSKQTEAIHFKTITNMNELQQALAAAKAKNQPVMIDFYADWCVACREMEKTVFNSEAVNQALKPFVKLRIDLTDNQPQTLAIAKRYNVFAPPSIVFYNNQGQELKKLQVFGEANAQSVLKYIEGVQ